MKHLLIVVLSFFNIVGASGQNKTAKIKVKKQKPHICVATFNGKWWDQTISKDSLINIGHLDLMGDCPNSAEICGFEMLVSSNGQINLLTSGDKYFTKSMIDRINQIGGSSGIDIQDVKYKLPNGKIIPTNDLMIYLKK